MARTSAGRSAQSGMVLMALGVLALPVGDTISKLLSADLAIFEIALWRFGGQTLLLAMIIAVLRAPARPVHLPLLALAGFLTAVTLACLIGAFAVMPIANAIAIFFVEPLILTLLSALILREKTGWRRYAAIGVGMAGALVVLRPNFATFGMTALYPLLGALAFAVHAVILRHVSKSMSALTVQLWVSLFASLALGAGLLVTIALGTAEFSNFDMPASRWALIGGGILLSTATFLMISEAFKRSPASTLAPFQYLEILGSVVMGYLVFADFPDALTWAGTAIILCAGLYVFHRERRAGQLDPKAAEYCE